MQNYFEGSVIAGLTFFILNRLFDFLRNRQSSDDKVTQNQQELFKIFLDRFSSSIDKLADRLEKLVTTYDEGNRIGSERLASVEKELTTMRLTLDHLVGVVVELPTTIKKSMSGE